MLALAACGSDHGGTADAQIIVTKDAAIDAKVWMDAPPGPTYDLSCYGATAGTNVADPITISGSTSTFSMSGQAPVGAVAVSVFKVGGATAAASTTSDAQGNFTLTNVATGGTALEHLVASKATYRTTYLYPSDPVRASIAGVPAIVITEQIFDLIATMGANVTQDDDVNGSLLIAVTDCSVAQPTPLEGATLSVKQGNTEVGDVFDLGAFGAGAFFVFNVPDGATDVTVTFDNMTFPVHTVMAHKKANATAPGTITATNILPGPLN